MGCRPIICTINPAREGCINKQESGLSQAHRACINERNAELKKSNPALPEGVFPLRKTHLKAIILRIPYSPLAL